MGGMPCKGKSFVGYDKSKNCHCSIGATHFNNNPYLCKVSDKSCLLFLRQRLPRYLFISHSSMVNERCHNNRCLRQVVAVHPFVSIHIGMVGAAAIFQWVLYELETRYAYLVKGNMVC